MKENNQINKTIIGEPGEGMSGSLKQALFDAISRGQKIIIIDPEGEYRELQKEDLVYRDLQKEDLVRIGIS